MKKAAMAEEEIWPLKNMAAWAALIKLPG